MSELISKIKEFISNNISPSHIRIFGWSIFGAFFITVAMPLLFFFYLFNPDDVRKMIYSQINSEHYVVKINGDVEPKTWHGLTLFVADTTVNDKQGKEILHINDANYQLSWPYLIIGKYKINRISLKGVTLTRTGSDGELINYDYFHTSEFDGLKYLSVTNLKVNNESGAELIDGANLRIRNINTNPEMELHLNLPQLKTQIELMGDFVKQEDVLMFDKLDTKLINDRFNLDAQSTAKLKLNHQELVVEEMNGLIDSNNYSGSLNIESGQLSFNGVATNKINATLRTKDISDTSQTINLNVANITSNNYINYIADLANLNLNSTYNNHDIKISLLSNKLNFDYLFNFSKQNISVSYNATCAESNNFPDSLTMSGLVSNNSINSLIDGNFIGNYQHSPFKTIVKLNYKNITPMIYVDGEIESLDFRDYSERTKTEILPLYQDTDPIDLNWLDKVNLTSNLSVNQLMLSRVSLNNVKANLQLNESQIIINDLNASTYKGKLVANVTISKTNEGYNFALNGKMNSVDLQKAFNNIFNVNAITGVADVFMATKSNKVKSFSDIYRGLTGSLLFNIRNGGFSGVDFNLFLNPADLAALMDQKTSRTQFNNLNAKFNFKNGLSESGSINFNSPTIQANGNGMVSFVDNKINYNLLIQSKLPENQHKVNSVVIPTTVMGELFKPKIYIKNMKLNKTILK